MRRDFVVGDGDLGVGSRVDPGWTSCGEREGSRHSWRPAPPAPVSLIQRLVPLKEPLARALGWVRGGSRVLDPGVVGPDHQVASTCWLDSPFPVTVHARVQPGLEHPGDGRAHWQERVVLGGEPPGTWTGVFEKGRCQRAAQEGICMVLFGPTAQEVILVELN